MRQEQQISRKNYLRQFYKKNKLNLFINVILTLLEVVFSLVLSLALKWVIDIATSGTIENINFATILLFIFMVAYIFYIILKMIFNPLLIKKSIVNYKKTAFINIFKKDTASFNSQEISNYVSSLSNDINYIETKYMQNILSIIGQTTLLIGSLVIMFYYSFVLTIVAIVSSVLPFVISLLIGNKLAKKNELVSVENEKFMHFIKDVFSGFSTIKAFKAEQRVNTMFEQKNEKLEQTKEKRNQTSIMINGMSQATQILVQLGVFIVGAYLAVTGKGITPAIIILFVQLMNFVVSPIAQLPIAISECKSCIPLIDKFVEYTKIDPKTEKKKVVFQDEIELNDITIKYDDQVVLNNVNYKFKMNKSYAIVGTSGSGKTTLLNLIMGKNLNYEGNVCYDSQELRDIDLDYLCENMTMIEQNVFVFDDSISNNITMYEDTDPELLNQVIEKAGLKKIINDKGLDFRCGENGKNLSGGEKQRIAIARGLLKQSKVLLLDEVTSALDNQTSDQIFNEVNKLDDVTKIFVIHTLKKSFLETLDEIIVINKGQIVENGSFDDLMKKNGFFSSLYNIGQ